MHPEMDVVGERLDNEEGRSTTEVIETPSHLRQVSSPASNATAESSAANANVASDLRNLLGDLATARARLAGYSDLVKAARAVFETEYAHLFVAQKEVAGIVSALDAEVRKRAIVEYGATQSKAVAPGVNIRMRDMLVYEPAIALAWAKEKGMALIPESLDVAAFEKIARATELSFVVYAETPEVTIASKLDAALAEASL